MTPSLTQIQSDFGVSRETSEALVCYADLLKKWTKTINLVSKKSIEDLWRRHVADSVQVYSSIAPVTSGRWLDLGSGGGLPGAVVAILSKEFSPEVSVTCVESDRRKATFLRTVSRETQCKFDVIDARIEGLAPFGADIVSARALAPLTDLLEFTHLHLKQEGWALFPKGSSYKSEIAEAQENWSFDCQEVPSATDPNSVLLKLRDIARV